MPRKFSILNGTKLFSRRRIYTPCKKFTRNYKKNGIIKNKGETVKEYLISENLCKSAHDRALQCINSNDSWQKKYTMAVEFDHLYIDCGDSKSSVSRDIKLQGLKELNLIHLDLIQQQAEQLLEKEKIIKSLKQENQNLKARLERIDRRVALSIHKKVSDVTPLSVQTEFPEHSLPIIQPDSKASPKGQHYICPKSPTSKSPNTKPVPKSPLYCSDKESGLGQDKNKKEIFRKSSPRLHQSFVVPPASPTLRVSPRDKKNKKEAGNSENCELGSLHCILLDSANEDNSFLTHHSTENKRTPFDERSPSPKKFKLMSPTEKALIPKSEDITDHSLRSRDKNKDSSCENFDEQSDLPFDILKFEPLPVSYGVETLTLSPSELSTDLLKVNSSDTTHWKVKEIEEPSKVPTEGILTTQEAYFIASPTKTTDFIGILDGEEEGQTQVEIPKWRMRTMSSLYVMEGTENLEDEVFIKRHSKHEQDERRRKRWDLQRMREQRQYEKLRERYEERNNPNGTITGKKRSLWPSPECTQFVHIDNLLPICAFGQPLSQIQESDFTVPWILKNRQGIPVKMKKHC